MSGRKRGIKIGGEVDIGACRGVRQSAHNDLGLRRKLAEALPHQLAKSPPDTVADHRVANGARHNETSPGDRRNDVIRGSVMGVARGDRFARRDQHVRNQGTATNAAASPDGGGELRPAP
jgi:hypothetical protein